MKALLAIAIIALIPAPLMAQIGGGNGAFGRRFFWHAKHQVPDRVTETSEHEETGRQHKQVALADFAWQQLSRKPEQRHVHQQRRELGQHKACKLPVNLPLPRAKHKVSRAQELHGGANNQTDVICHGLRQARTAVQREVDGEIDASGKAAGEAVSQEPPNPGAAVRHAATITLVNTPRPPAKLAA
jgi:hypothetical protein